jgi:hypothetical protein
MKKIFLVALCALMSVCAWSATVDELVTIKSDWTFIADDITSNGTAGLVANNLYADGRIFTPTGNTAAANKGKSTIGGEEHFNSLRLKNVQDRLAFKVAEPCTVTFYTQNHSTRGIVVSKVDRTDVKDAYYASQPGSTPVWELELDEAGTYYLSNHDGDFFLAGFVFTFPKAPIDPSTLFTFGLTAGIDAQNKISALSILPEECPHVSSSEVMATYGILADRDVYHGDETVYNGAITYRNSVQNNTIVISSKEAAETNDASLEEMTMVLFCTELR